MRFPDVLDPPLEYARMYVEVMAWVRSAELDDDCEALVRLAQEYIALSIESCRRETQRLAELVAPELLACRDNSERQRAPERPLSRAEAEDVRRCSAVTSAAQLEHLSYSEMQRLADMVEGWAHDPRFGACEIARSLGLADGLRNLAEVAGHDWVPPEQDKVSLSAFLARAMLT